MQGIEIRITDPTLAHLEKGGPELQKYLEERVGPWLDDVMMNRIDVTIRGAADKFEKAAVLAAFYNKIVEDERNRAKSPG